MENNPIKILAIDDIKDNLIILSALIREKFDNVQITTASSGQEGIELALRENPDLILLDIVMPGMDGYETCRRLKKEKALRDIPVVFITALKGDKESRIKALEAGSDAFLAKPVDESELTAQIRAMVKVKLANAEKRDEQKRLQKLVKDKTAELKKNHLATLNLLEDLKTENDRRKESEAKFRSLIESSNDGISLLDLDGNILFVNSRKVAMLGYDNAEELTGINGFSIFPEKERKEFQANEDEFRKNGFLPNTETRMLCKDGSIIPVEINLRLIIHDNSRSQFIMTTTRDISERKKAEAQLKQLSQAVKQSPASVVITNSQGVIEYVNPKFSEVTGYTLEEAIGNKPSVLKSGYQSDEVYRELWQTISSGKVWQGDLHNKKKNGDFFWEAASISPIIGDNGEVTHYLAVKEDITQKKMAEEAIQESEKKFRTLFETSNDAIFIMDNEQFIDCNPAALKMFACRADDMIGSSPTNFSPPYQPNGADSQQMASEKIKIASSGGTQTFEWKHKRCNGSLFDAEVSLNTFSMKGKEYLQATVRDITERKREELRRQIQLNIAKAILTSESIELLINYVKEQLSLLIDTSNFIVALYDADTDMMQPVIYKDEMEGYAQWPATQSLSGQIIKLGVKLLLQRDEITQFAAERHLRLIGTPAACWMGVPLMVDNKIAGAMATQSYTDLNAFGPNDLALLEMVAYQTGVFIERRKMLQELIDAKEKAEQSNKLKTAFIQNISHEIRTPITGLTGFASLMADEDTTPEERREHFHRVDQSTRRLINTISDYMDMARLVSGTMEVNKSTFPFTAVVRETIGEFDELIRQKQLLFEVSITDEISNMQVNTDQEMFRRVLFELIDNAIKFTDKGKISVSCVEESQRLLVTVKDQGRGVPKEKITQIFDAFTQAETSLNRGHEGSGVGLSIAKGLVDLMGGKIWVQSTVGEGSAFSFVIPLLAAGKKMEAPSRKTPLPKSDTKPVVLIAEDDESNYLLMEVLVKKAGCDYIMVYDGVQAVEACRRHPEITFVLMDIKMPLLNGVEALQQIREFRPDLPIIATTAYAQLGDERRFKEMGFNEYFAKPLKPETIVRFVKEYAAI